MKKNLYKLLNWEYWPSQLFYLPNIPYAVFLAIKAKNITFYSAANPSIKSAGNGTESKYKTLQLIPEKHRPKSILHRENSKIDNTLHEILKNKITFPLIAKPDIGFRGLLVNKIDTINDLKIYLKKYPIDIIIQEFIDYKNECGVFYLRKPNDNKGDITSITLKKFLTVIGNNTSTIKELIEADKRARLYKNLIFKSEKIDLKRVPKKNEIIKLSVIGNHCKGTQFTCGNHLINNKIKNTFDKLNKEIPGWFYGRIDLKYNSFEDLENGLDFKILEINGIISEPTHIYDSNNYNYFNALKEVRKHWKYLYEISTINHQTKNIPYKGFKEFYNEIRELKKYTTKIKEFSKN